MLTIYRLWVFHHNNNTRHILLCILILKLPFYHLDLKKNCGIRVISIFFNDLLVIKKLLNDIFVFFLKKNKKIVKLLIHPRS